MLQQVVASSQQQPHMPSIPTNVQVVASVHRPRDHRATSDSTKPCIWINPLSASLLELL